MASSPITSRQIDGETMETVTDFIFLGSKITADSDSIYEIKRCLLLGRNIMTNLDNILKNWGITLPTKVHLVKAMVFTVVTYGCESWTIKKAEHWRIDAFELWCWRRLLRVPWTASWIFIGKTEAEAESPIVWPPDMMSWLMRKDPDAGKDWRLEEKGKTEDEIVGWPHWLNGHEFEQAPGVGDRQGSLVCCSPWGHKVRHDWASDLNWGHSIYLQDPHWWRQYANIGIYNNRPNEFSRTDTLQRTSNQINDTVL